MNDKLAICLWFDTQGEDAANFYCDLFPDSAIKSVNASPMDWPGGKIGDAITVELTLLGNTVTMLNGGPNAEFNEKVSLQVFTDTQAETDRYWNALIADGGTEMGASWCKDRFGVRWQVVPRVLMAGLSHSDDTVRGQVFAAMNQMMKIDHAGIEAAIKG